MRGFDSEAPSRSLGVRVRLGSVADVEAMGWATSRSLVASWRTEAARSGSLVLIGELDGAVAGKCFADLTRDADVLWFHSLSVDPAKRGRGVGTALTNAVEQVAWERGRGWVELSVDADNTGARALYLRLGYVDGGPYLDRVRYVDDDDTVVVREVPGALMRRRVRPHGRSDWSSE